MMGKIGQGQTLINRLASLICHFDTSLINEQAISLSRTAIIDTLGVTLAGVVEPSVVNLLKTQGIGTAPGQSTIFGTDKKTSALDAAFINGVGSHAHDYDDFSQPMGGHQSAPLVAPLFALAEERGKSGLQLIHAYVVGIETEIRIARAVNFHHYDLGWHPTATLGIFGTVAACGHLIGLSEEKMSVALGIAASLASGLKSNFGTMVKPLHVGQSGRNGLLAVLLAESGYDSNPETFEHKQGFLNVFNGPGNYNAELMFENWANPLEVLSTEMGLKQFPCCGSTHPAITMMLQLRKEHAIDLDQVNSVLIQVHKRRLPHTYNPNPVTSLEAKFSVQYVVSRALVSGSVRLGDFEGEAHFDKKVREIMVKTTAMPHPDMADDSSEQFGAEVSIKMKDGQVLTRKISNLVGRGISYPMTNEEMWEKFNDCAETGGLPRADIPPLFERLESLEKVADIRTVARMMAKRSLPGNIASATGNIDTAGEKGNPSVLQETSWVP
jgi:2-methylcitrate dehydratase PrpD